jgi:hypothetical protein
MLTESEREWLEQRGCRTRKMPLYVNEYLESLPYLIEDLEVLLHRIKRKGWQRYYADLFKEAERRAEALAKYTKAAEFEARVAAKLANIHFGTEDCPYCSNHINVNEYCGDCKTASTDKRCLACRLKYARLKAEEEMDAEMDK